MKRTASPQSGFSLIEMLVAVALFVIVTAALFQLLNVAQQRYRMESEVLDSFQGARLAMDQLTRDIHSSGYPPANQFSAAAIAAFPQRVAVPFGYSPGYPAVPGCTMGGACTTPTQWDLIVEADIDPQAGNGIEWIRYRLNGRILERGVATKTAGGDPAAATLLTMTPFIENVVNNANAAEMGQIRASYLTMFPGNAAVPLFTYRCQPAGGVPGPPVACTAAHNPRDIREVNITIIVRSASNDPRTRQPRVITLTGRARRINPSS